MPDPDSPASVITVSSGIKKANESWIIGRLIRDLEGSVTQDFKEWKEYNNHGELGDSGEGESGLLVTCFEVCRFRMAGSPRGSTHSRSLLTIDTSRHKSKQAVHTETYGGHLSFLSSLSSLLLLASLLLFTATGQFF